MARTNKAANRRIDNRKFTFREFNRTLLPQIEAMVRTEWNADWIGAGLYKTADEFFDDYKGGDGNLQRVAELYKASDLYIPAGQGVECTFVHDVWGTELDFAAYMTGEPECFINIQPAEAIKTNLTIKVLHGLSSGVDAKQATERYLKLADLYTAALPKYNVRVVLEWAGDSQSSSHSLLYKYEVELCGFGEILSPLTLVSALSTPVYRGMMMGITGTWGSRVHCNWHPDQMPYLHKASVTRTDDEIIIAPMHNRTASEWDLPNMLKAAGLMEGE